MPSVVRLVALALALAGCSVDDIAPEGRPCPCGPDTVCNPATNTCVRMAVDLGLPDGPAPDRAAALGDAGLPLGQSCTGADQCRSGNCADGVCCDAPCDVPCTACNLDGKEGKCSAEPPGTSCAPAVCQDSHTLAPEKTCDAAGLCQGAGTTSCAPYLCDMAAAACSTSCEDDGDCSTGARCADHKCLAPAGTPCGGAGECVSGFCADGVCCDTACAGPCRSCALANNEGTCTNVASGTDPDNDCSAAPPSTCGNDGSCDGNGACREHPAKTVCSAVCDSEGGDYWLENVKGCDGNGSCSLPLADQSCPGNFACSPFTDECYSSCTADSQCTGEWACDQLNGICFTKCMTDAQCKPSGGCSSGVCD
jgi:hypothetical protein